MADSNPSVNLREAFKHCLKMLLAMGISPTKVLQEEFDVLWYSIPQLPVLGEIKHGMFTKAIETRVNEIISDTNEDSARI